MKKRSLCVWSFVFCAILFFTGSQAMAQNNPLCETALWDQMTDRALLHGQMDTEKAETLMYKPDSVLEYTCYDRFYNWALADGNMPYYMSEGRAVAPMYIGNGTPNYLFGNFPHTYLGGRADPDTDPPPAGPDYSCDAMQRVWDMARCLQMIDEDPQDDMVDLVEFTTMDDPRTLPAACTVRYASSDLGSIPATASTITANIEPPSGTVECGDPIPTGKVITEPLRPTEPGSRPLTFNEKVCPNPGCSYVPTDVDTGDCVEN